MYDIVTGVSQKFSWSFRWFFYLWWDNPAHFVNDTTTNLARLILLVICFIRRSIFITFCIKSLDFCCWLSVVVQLDSVHLMSLSSSFHSKLPGLFRGSSTGIRPTPPFWPSTPIWAGWIMRNLLTIVTRLRPEHRDGYHYYMGYQPDLMPTVGHCWYLQPLQSRWQYYYFINFWIWHRYFYSEIGPQRFQKIVIMKSNLHQLLIKIWRSLSDQLDRSSDNEYVNGLTGLVDRYMES